MKIGVLAVQGNFAAHVDILTKMNIPVTFVTHPKHLTGIQGLILPGGESTTMLKFLWQNHFADAMTEFALAGRCLFGTCAGAILLANEVLNPPQISLKLIDVTIERNAYGRQLSSHIGMGDFYQGKQKQAMEMVFIRAPKITQFGNSTQVFATYHDQAVGVMNEKVMLTTFHPELTQNHTIHQLFIDNVRKNN